MSQEYLEKLRERYDADGRFKREYMGEWAATYLPCDDCNMQDCSTCKRWNRSDAEG